MTTGEIIAFINYVNQILLALTVVANLVITFTKAYASAGLAGGAGTEPSIHGAEQARKKIRQRPAVEFRQVDFSYGGGENALSASRTAARATVGVIGGTGSGQSPR